MVKVSSALETQMRICCTFVVSLLISLSSAWAQVDVPHYLSFEEKTALAYALLAYEKPVVEQEVIYQRLLNASKSLESAPVKTITVNSFEEFLEQYRGEWPKSHSLEKNIELIEKTFPLTQKKYTSKSPRIQRKIDDFLLIQKQQTLNLFLGSNAFQGKNFLDLITEIPIEAKSMALSTENPDVMMLKAMTLAQINHVIRETISNIETTGTSQISKLNISDRRLQILVQTFFTEYFSRLSLDTKKAIISDLLDEDLKASPLKKIEIMILNSGPQFQKLLQIMSREKGLPPDLITLFKKLESSSKPVPPALVKEVLDNESANYKFLNVEVKPIGTGTMAQVHRAKIADDGKERSVVVRFLKPGIHAKVAEDHLILQELARILDTNAELMTLGAPKLTPLVDDITKTIKDELNVQDTVARQIEAKKHYTKNKIILVDGYKSELNITVPEIIQPQTQKTDMMVQEMVFGQKLDKEFNLWSSIMPSLKRVIVEQIAELWIEELVFKSGFYHSDLHQGNFLVRLTDPGLDISIIDFGMGGKIAKSQQEAILLLGIAVELKNPESMAELLWDLTDTNKNNITKRQLAKLIRKKLDTLALEDRELKADEWMVWGSEVGLKLSYDMISINRGFLILNKLLEEAGSDLDCMSLSQRLALKYPRRVLQLTSERANLGLNDYFTLLNKLLKPKTIAEVRCQDLFR